jgi:hypothetical protein
MHQVLHSVVQKETLHIYIYYISVSPDITGLFTLLRMTQIDEFEARQKEAKEAWMARR